MATAAGEEAKDNRYLDFFKLNSAMLIQAVVIAA